MKKIIAVGLAVTAFAGVLAGCGGEETSSAGSAASGAVQGATKSTMVFADSQAPTNLEPSGRLEQLVHVPLRDYGNPV